jgi:GTP cyclohydrolase IA
MTQNKVKSKLVPSELEAAYAVIVSYMQGSCLRAEETENFDGTPERCARALTDMILPAEDIVESLDGILSKTFPLDSGAANEGNSGMVVQGPIQVHSMCPHHLMHVEYDVFIGYIPTGSKVLGLSKLARIAKILGRRPVLQEQFAADVADVMHFKKGNVLPGLETQGSAVSVVGRHSCMSCRGVHDDAVTAVMELRGVFWEATMETKFQSSINNALNSRVARVR